MKADKFKSILLIHYIQLNPDEFDYLRKFAYFQV